MTRAVLEKLFYAGRIIEPAYAGLMGLRASCYQRGWFRTMRVSVPVISIGNLLMGGTGKTPHVIALCRFLQKQGILPAVVTRGYGGRAGRGPLVVSDGRVIRSDADTAGDEPVMMAESLPGIPVIAGSERYAGAQAAIRHFEARVIVLDDGFQHMGLFRDRDVVLIPARAPFGNSHVFPAGELREPVSALRRATCLLVTGCEQVTDSEVTFLKHRLFTTVPGIPVFISRTVPAGLRLLFSAERGTSGRDASEGYKRLPAEDWKVKPVLAFCGIGSPESFFTMLSRNGFCVCSTISFRDHHRYTPADLEKIASEAKNAGAAAIITTAKDAVKIEAMSGNTSTTGSTGYGHLPVLVLEMNSVPEQGFWNHILLSAETAPHSSRCGSGR